MKYLGNKGGEWQEKKKKSNLLWNNLLLVLLKDFYTNMYCLEVWILHALNKIALASKNFSHKHDKPLSWSPSQV